jgi:hypothetical protein
MNNEERAFNVLEQAIAKAQESLEKTKSFQPFAMVLKCNGELEFFKNELKDTIESYEELEKRVKELVCSSDIDVLAMAVDTSIPENFSKNTPQSIRLHVEEKCRVDNKIGARYIYVPYELYQSKEKQNLQVKLQAPIAVGFPAEYIVK